MSDFLVIGGTRVPIAAPSGADEEYQEIGGEVVRSFSGRLLSTVKGRARVWRLQTPPLPESEAQALVAALAHGSPLMCSGALIGSDPVSCYARGVRTRPVAPLSRLRRVVEFELHEAAPMASPMLFRLHAGEPLSAAGAAFSRASSAWYIDRDGILREAAPNVPRVEWLDLDGDGVRETPTALLEPAATNLLRDSCNLPASGSAWGSTSNFTVSPAASIFQGQTAWRHQNLGLMGSAGRSQSIGTFTGQPETASAIVENVNATETALSIRDSTTATNVCIGRLTWATGAASVQSGTGTVLARKLANAGPNGGPVYRLIVTATGTAGNTRSVLIYPSGTSQNTQTAIVHHVQHEVGSIATSPIVTTTAAVTRSADVLTSPWPHAPQAMTGYLRFVERGAIAYPDTRALFQIGTGSTRPRLWVRQSSGQGRYGIVMYGMDADSIATSLLPASPVPAIGDRVELLWRLYPDGSVQIEQSINGGTPVVSARSSAVGMPTAWNGQVMRLSGVPSSSTTDAPAAWRDAIVLRGAGWTLDEVRRMLR